MDVPCFMVDRTGTVTLRPPRCTFSDTGAPGTRSW